MKLIEPINSISSGDIIVADGDVFIVGHDAEGYHLRKFNNPENTMHKSWSTEKRRTSENFMRNLIDYHSTVVHYSKSVYDLKLVPKK